MNERAPGALGEVTRRGVLKHRCVGEGRGRPAAAAAARGEMHGASADEVVVRDVSGGGGRARERVRGRDDARLTMLADAGEQALAAGNSRRCSG